MSHSLARRMYGILAVLIAIIAGYSYTYRTDIFRPDPCICREIFSGDSVLAMHAARRLVGNGYYVFTIPAGREACAAAYPDPILPDASQVVMNPARMASLKAFFDSACLR